MPVESAQPVRPEPHEVFSGWKEIANYLGKGVRTVQRYERELGLPVRRPTGRERGSVMATKVELDAWVAARPLIHEFQLTWHKAASLASPIASMKNHVDEMRTLYAEMRGLRSDLQASVRLLRESIAAVQYNRLAGFSVQEALYNLVGRNFRNERTLKVLEFPGGKRKVN